MKADESDFREGRYYYRSEFGDWRGRMVPVVSTWVYDGYREVPAADQGGGRSACYCFSRVVESRIAEVGQLSASFSSLETAKREMRFWEEFAAFLPRLDDIRRSRLGRADPLVKRHSARHGIEDDESYLAARPHPYFGQFREDDVYYRVVLAIGPEPLTPEISTWVFDRLLDAASKPSLHNRFLRRVCECSVLCVENGRCRRLGDPMAMPYFGVVRWLRSWTDFAGCGPAVNYTIDMHYAAEKLPDLVHVRLKGEQTDGSLLKLANRSDVSRLSVSVDGDTSELECLGTLPNLRYLWLSDRSIGNRELLAVAKLRQLKRLHISTARVDDDGLKHLAGLHALESLILMACRVTGTGFSYMAELENLTTLWLWENPVSDDGVRRLEALPGLTTLHLKWTSITDRALAHVTKLRNLACLDLTDGDITDAGLAHLKSGVKLEIVNLTRTRITDAGLRQLVDLPNLENLDLQGTAISDKGIELLAKMKPLRRVNVRGTLVTKEGAERLAEALPACQIHR